jgi:hypothetical protein
MAIDESVRDFREFTGVGQGMLSNEDVAKLLKVRRHQSSQRGSWLVCQLNNNDLEQAVGKFFELDEAGGSAALRKHLDGSDGAWDDTVFGAGRYGQDDTPAVIPSTYDSNAGGGLRLTGLVPSF